MKHKTYLIALIALSAMTAFSTVDAETSRQNDGQAITKVKISLMQAVTTAEKYIGGKASRAEFEHHQNQDIFDIEVVKGSGAVMDVAIDAHSGQIIHAEHDRVDHEGDRENDEDRD